LELVDKKEAKSTLTAEETNCEFHMSTIVFASSTAPPFQFCAHPTKHPHPPRWDDARIKVDYLDTEYDKGAVKAGRRLAHRQSGLVFYYD
jgi:hypothetical protein